MRIVIEGYKSKRLEHASLTFSHRMQHFRHALDIAGLSLKRNFHEIAFREAPRKLQQSAVQGNNLDVALGMLAVAELNDYRCGCEFNPTSTMGRVRLGIVCHAETTMAPGRRRGEITEAQCPDSWAFRALTAIFSHLRATFSLEGLRMPSNETLYYRVFSVRHRRPFWGSHAERDLAPMRSEARSNAATSFC